MASHDSPYLFLGSTILHVKHDPVLILPVKYICQTLDIIKRLTYTFTSKIMSAGEQKYAKTDTQTHYDTGHCP